ncbi:hypothetical protein [Roseobacter sp.]|uniref:hypothetical protein n=1 Tax=Roseobacter sp. TaxID=1907202 RepID=UPI00385D7F48
MSVSKVRLSCLTAAAISASGASLLAQSAQEWEYQITPYLWGAGQTGQVQYGPGVPPVDIDLSFSDILENLDLAGMIIFSANKGRYGLTFDYQYVNVGMGGATPGTDFGNADVNSILSLGTVLGEYRIRNTNETSLWAGGGLRYWNVSTDLSLTAGTQPAISASSGDNWFDPMLGLRGRTSISDKWFATGWAYAGGFGAGSESMVDVLGGVGYDFTDAVSGVFGYRYLSVDREEPGFSYDVEQQGFMAGVSFNF